MLFQPFLWPVWVLCDFLIDLMPSMTFQKMIDSGFLGILGFGVRVIGINNLMMMLSSVVMWTGVQFTWAAIEWVYNKIPGVN